MLTDPALSSTNMFSTKKGDPIGFASFCHNAEYQAAD